MSDARKKQIKQELANILSKSIWKENVVKALTLKNKKITFDNVSEELKKLDVYIMNFYNAQLEEILIDQKLFNKPNKESDKKAFEKAKKTREIAENTFKLAYERAQKIIDEYLDLHEERIEILKKLKKNDKEFKTLAELLTNDKISIHKKAEIYMVGQKEIFELGKNIKSPKENKQKFEELKNKEDNI